MGKHKTRKELVNARKSAFPEKLMASKLFFIVAGIALTLLSVVYFSSGIPEITRSEKDDVSWDKAKDKWSLKPLTKEDFAVVVNSINIDRLKAEYLKRFLVVRPSGSKENKRIQQFISKTMSELGWTVDMDEFKDKIPSNQYVDFGNVIATLNPGAKRRLVIACHHDSKIKPLGFIGATDSAVPCAMMMEMAKALGNYLTNLAKDSDLTLQYIFFDGEEAFDHWTNTDSIYGARHLAKKWSTQPWPIDSVNSVKTVLDSIDQLVLLDLLGAINPTVQQTRSVQSRHFKDLIRIEESLLAYEKKPSKSKRYFSPKISEWSIGDDHVPFLERGVPILHIIPTPFPLQWHNVKGLEDTEKNLDYPTIRRLTQILAVYIAEYLHLEPHTS